MKSFSGKDAGIAAFLEARERILQQHKEELNTAIKLAVEQGRFELHLTQAELKRFAAIFSKKLENCLFCEIARWN